MASDFLGIDVWFQFKFIDSSWMYSRHLWVSWLATFTTPLGFIAIWILRHDKSSDFTSKTGGDRIRGAIKASKIALSASNAAMWRFTLRQAWIETLAKQEYNAVQFSNDIKIKKHEMFYNYLFKYKEMLNIPIAIEQSRTISPSKEDAWMSICIRARDFFTRTTPRGGSVHYLILPWHQVQEDVIPCHINTVTV